jgi:hypothetical protein
VKLGVIPKTQKDEIQTPISGDDWHQVTTTGSAFSALHMTISAHQKKCFPPFFLFFVWFVETELDGLQFFIAVQTIEAEKKGKTRADLSLSLFPSLWRLVNEQCSQEDCWVVFIDRMKGSCWSMVAATKSQGKNRKKGE